MEPRGRLGLESLPCGCDESVKAIWGKWGEGESRATTVWLLAPTRAWRGTAGSMGQDARCGQTGLPVCGLDSK